MNGYDFLNGGQVTIPWAPSNPVGAITVGNPQSGKVATVGGEVVVENPKYNLEFGFLYDIYDNDLKAHIKAVIGLGPTVQLTGGASVDYPSKCDKPIIQYDYGVKWSPGEFQPISGMLPVKPSLTAGGVGGNTIPNNWHLQLEIAY